MAEFVTADSNAHANVLFCVATKFAFFTKQWKIRDKLCKIENAGGSVGPEYILKVCHSMTRTLSGALEKVQHLEKGNLTDVEGFELLKKLTDTRDVVESDEMFGVNWTPIIDETILAVLERLEDAL